MKDIHVTIPYVCTKNVKQEKPTQQNHSWNKGWKAMIDANQERNINISDLFYCVVFSVVLWQLMAHDLCNNQGFLLKTTHKQVWLELGAWESTNGFKDEHLVAFIVVVTKKYMVLVS